MEVTTRAVEQPPGPCDAHVTQLAPPQPGIGQCPVTGTWVQRHAAPALPHSPQSGQPAMLGRPPTHDAARGQSPDAANEERARSATLTGASGQEHPIEAPCDQLPVSEESLTEAWELADLEDFFGPDAHML